MVIVMVICFLLCWLPYGIMALIATFGPPGFITPAASIIPSVLAKSSTVYNPIIYIFLNKQFYRCFIALLHCSSVPQSSSFKGSSKSTKICLATRKPPDNSTFKGASPKLANSGEDKESSTNVDTNSVTVCQKETNNQICKLQQKLVVTLVAHYTP
ncbi:pinopsin-like [Pseudophryne corroboree]|uniref:pinopsin-like n=1 Tax=Pseudophryne corroboree TaxID=495146 RepID=UPI0030813B79